MGSEISLVEIKGVQNQTGEVLGQRVQWMLPFVTDLFSTADLREMTGYHIQKTFYCK